jgi:hypothetical protein
MPAGQVVDYGPVSGATFGKDVNAKISLYGVTPVVQRANSIQASSFMSLSTNATVPANLASWCAEVSTTLTNLGIWKGAA